MRSFVSEDKFHMKGRGDVYTLRLKEEVPTAEVYNQEILVDGVKYICRGINRFCNRLSDPILGPDEAIGLLVEKI